MRVVLILYISLRLVSHFSIKLLIDARAVSQSSTWLDDLNDQSLEELNSPIY